MIDEDDLEEWPIITMNSSNNVSQDPFRMPSAEELAEERERELECERELKRLREDEKVVRDEERFSSGGDEAETAALAHAVNALLVEQVVSPPPHPSVLLTGMARCLSPAARELLLHPHIELLLPEVAREMGSAYGPREVEWAPHEAEWSPLEAACVCALLGAGALGGNACASRALHATLDCRLPPSQAQAVGALLLDGVSCPRALLQLGDVLRAGAAPLALDLAALATDRALLMLLGEPYGRAPLGPPRLTELLSARWPALSPDDAYLVLQLVGRRLAGPGPHAELTDLLHALHVPAHGHDTQRPDLLKVVVAVSRLRLLYRAGN